MNATSFASSNRDWLGATVEPAPRCRHRGSNFGWRVGATNAADWRPCRRDDNRAPNSKTGAWGYAGRDGRTDCSSGTCVVVAGHSSCLKSEENPAASSITNRATQEEQNEEGRKVIAQEEGRKSPGRRRIFKPSLPDHFHPAADKSRANAPARSAKATSAWRYTITPTPPRRIGVTPTWSPNGC